LIIQLIVMFFAAFDTGIKSLKVIAIGNILL